MCKIGFCDNCLLEKRHIDSFFWIKKANMYKRLLTIAAVIVLINFNVSAYCDINPIQVGDVRSEEPKPESEEPEKIKIMDVRKGEKPQTRSFINSVDAYASMSENCIELIFNENLGIVSIKVSGPSGIESVTCDTASEFFVTIPVSFVPGQYFIEISGPEYEGYGQFEL